MDVRELFEIALSDLTQAPDGADATRARLRRGDLREAVLRQAARRRTRRVVSRAVATAAAAMVALLLAVTTTRSPRAPAIPEPDARSPIAWVTAVRNDPTVVERLRAPAPTRVIAQVSDHPIEPQHLLDDVGLSRWLHAAGRPAAVLRTADLVVVAEPTTE